MKLFLIFTFLFSLTNAFAQNCETLEKAKIGLVLYTALAQYPFSGHQTIADFADLKSVDESNQTFCHFNGEDCGETNIDFGMMWSFQPGMRGWLGITKNCEVDYAATFVD